MNLLWHNHNRSIHSNGCSIQKKWKSLMYDLQSLNCGGTARDDCVWRHRVRVTGPAWAAFPADMVDWGVETTAPGRKLSLMTYPLLSSPRRTAVNPPQSPLRPRRRPSGWYYFCWAQRSISASVCAVFYCHTSEQPTSPLTQCHAFTGQGLNCIVA